MLLSELPNGSHALVERVFSGAPEVGSTTVQRLEELGFIAGEPVLMLRRGPGGREPLAVQIGDTEERMLEAIEFLCQPDAESTHREHEGRRMVREGQFQYYLPQWEVYQEINRQAKLRDSNRARQAGQKAGPPGYRVWRHLRLLWRAYRARSGNNP